MPEGLFADPASGPALASRGSRVSRRFLQQLPPGHGGLRHWRFGPPAAQGPRARLPGHDHWPLGRHGCRRESPGPDWRHDCRSPRCTVRSPPAEETSSVASPPAVGGSRSSFAVSSLFWASPASRGTRNPVRYQREGAWGRISASSSEPFSGPTRSRRNASTSWLRTSTGFIDPSLLDLIAGPIAGTILVDTGRFPLSDRLHG